MEMNKFLETLGKYPKSVMSDEIYFPYSSIVAAYKELNEGFFNIPSMCISKDDIISRFEGSDDFEEKQKQIEKLTDEQMQTIANQMTDLMMDDFWEALDVAYECLITRLQR
jgi:hypothetical protein